MFNCGIWWSVIFMYMVEGKLPGFQKGLEMPEKGPIL